MIKEEISLWIKVLVLNFRDIKVIIHPHLYLYKIVALGTYQPFS